MIFQPLWADKCSEICEWKVRFLRFVPGISLHECEFLYSALLFSFFYLALLLLCACSAAVNGLTPNSSLVPQDATFTPSNGPDVVGTDHENTSWPLV